jgi:hypothetical protein
MFMQWDEGRRGDKDNAEAQRFRGEEKCKGTGRENAGWPFEAQGELDAGATLAFFMGMGWDKMAGEGLAR